MHSSLLKHIEKVKTTLVALPEQLTVMGLHAIYPEAEHPGDVIMMYSGKKSITTVNKTEGIRVIKPGANGAIPTRRTLVGGIMICDPEDAMIHLLTQKTFGLDPFIFDRCIRAKEQANLPHLFRLVQDDPSINAFIDMSGTYNIINNAGVLLWSCGRDAVIRIYSKTDYMEFDKTYVTILGYKFPYSRI